MRNISKCRPTITHPQTPRHSDGTLCALCFPKQAFLRRNKTNTHGKTRMQPKRQPARSSWGSAPSSKRVKNKVPNIQQFMCHKTCGGEKSQPFVLLFLVSSSSTVHFITTTGACLRETNSCRDTLGLVIKSRTFKLLLLYWKHIRHDIRVQ